MRRRFYLGRILTQAGITSVHTQTQINVIISCWSLAVAVAGSFMLDIIGRRVQTIIGISGMVVTLYVLGGLIKSESDRPRLSRTGADTSLLAYGGSTNTSGIYGTIAVIFLFQGFYAFSITPMTSLYPTEICSYRIRTAGTAVFRFFDSGFGLLCSFCMSFAMSDLGWKFYLINASWAVLFLVFVVVFFVETKGLNLEEIGAKFGDVVFVDGIEESGSEMITDVGPNKHMGAWGDVSQARRPSVS